jgi:hypothetical protein
MESGVPHGPVPDIMFPRVTGNILNQVGTGRVGEGVMSEGARDQIARTPREFRFVPKGRARAYQKPYRIMIPSYKDRF